MPDAIDQLVAIAERNGADLGDDALIYAGSATWDDWRNHVPDAVRAVWPVLDRAARAAAYLTANAVTAYQLPPTNERVHVLEDTMLEALQNCEQCRYLVADSTSRCARCKTFHKLLFSTPDKASATR